MYQLHRPDTAVPFAKPLGALSFPSNRGGFGYAAMALMVRDLSNAMGDVIPAEPCLRLRL